MRAGTPHTAERQAEHPRWQPRRDEAAYASTRGTSSHLYSIEKQDQAFQRLVTRAPETFDFGDRLIQAPDSELH